MTSARIQLFRRKHSINIGYFDGGEVWLRNITERIIEIKLPENAFCLIRKSNHISFNEATEELENKFKIIDSVSSRVVSTSGGGGVEVPM